jgi:hypothetical protein
MMATGCAENEREKADEVLRRYCNLAGQPADDYRVPTPRFERDGYIYFATCQEDPDFPIKIGYATELKSRLGGLQTGLPWKVVLLASFVGTRDDERKLHLYYRHDRLLGEWFKRSADLIELIKGHQRNAA